MRYIIVGVHGLANKPSEPTLTNFWKKSILAPVRIGTEGTNWYSYTTNEKGANDEIYNCRCSRSCEQAV